MQTALHRAPATVDIDALCSLDRFEKPRRPAYDWSLERPGAAWHVDPITDAIPADLDPDLAPGMITVPLSIRLEQGRAERLEHRRALMIGITAAALLAMLSIAAVTAAAIRLPQIEQQLAAAARV